MTKSRIEAFTDAVIAIVMTILVLELHIPVGDSFSAFAGMEHQFIIYLISFCVLAIYWNNHHHLFQLVKRVDGLVLWANNFLILALSILPFATSWVSDHPLSLAPQVIYGCVILLADFAYLLLGRALVRANSQTPQLKALFTRYKKLYLSIGLNIFALVVGYFVHPVLIIVLDAFVLLLWVIPERIIEKTIDQPKE
ncbi:putative membrane protein [Lachnospiraceae bacterium PF1-21]